ncbi:MAG: DEAD/DEAH box helicase [Bacteroidales bacterium]|jgi:ATP-dependent RNA helicase DeaD|nr:DEAD/DEAH box helicase [Bacteroidales bacterium]
MEFIETNLSQPLLLAVEELGFKTLTPIQEKTIKLILENDHDMIGLAETGTGKTAAFGLPLLEKTDVAEKAVQTIILSPTRELCMQIAKDLENYAKFMNGVHITAVYGGASIDTQITKLKRGSHIIVGTPGRTVDLIKRRALKLNNVRYLVLDEADEMLNMGFKEDLDFILEQTPSEKQTLLFSATMPREIRNIAETYMNSPEEVSVGKRNMGAENVSHQYYVTHAKDRYVALKRIVDINPKIYGIIFCRTRTETKEVADKLIQDGYNADALHGDLSQAQRDFVMNRFRIRHLQLLIATDVAARGLDVDNLTHVINYNLPDELEAYIHRSGRTGRAGRKGVSISLLHTRETRKVRDLERMVGKQFERKMVPSGFDVCEKQLFNFIDRVENIEVDEKQIEQYLAPIYKKLDWLQREDLIKHFVSVEFNRFLEYYKNAPDLNANVDTSRDGKFGRDNRDGRDRRSSRDDRDGRDRRDSRNDRDSWDDKPKRDRSMAYSRFHINVGEKEGLSVPRMIGLINDYCRRRDIPIGKIDVLRKFSFFEVDAKFESHVLSSFAHADFNGTPLEVTLSKPDTHGSKEKSKPAFGGKKKSLGDDKSWKKDKKPSAGKRRRY